MGEWFVSFPLMWTVANILNLKDVGGFSLSGTLTQGIKKRACFLTILMLLFMKQCVSKIDGQFSNVGLKDLRSITNKKVVNKKNKMAESVGCIFVKTTWCRTKVSG